MILKELKQLIRPIVTPQIMGIAPLILAGIAAAPALGKIISGIGQRKQAKKIKPDPLTAATRQATALAQQRAGATTMPGEEQIKASVRQSTANAIANAQKAGTSTADILAAGSAANVGEQRAMTDIGIQSAGFKDVAQTQLMEQKNREAIEMAMNRQQAQAMQAQLQASGTENIFGGLSDITNVGIGAGMGVFGDVTGGKAPGGNTYSEATKNLGRKNLFGQQFMQNVPQFNPMAGTNFMQQNPFLNYNNVIQQRRTFPTG